MKVCATAKKCLILLPLLYVPSAFSAAQDIQVLTNVSVNVTGTEIKVEESFNGSGQATWDGSTETRTISSNSSSSTLGVTVIKDRFNVGLTALVSGVDPAQAEGDIVLGDGTGITSVVDAAISRTSYSLLGGYVINDNWSGYAGYTSSATQAGATFTFEDRGPFLGAKYIHRMSASSSLTVNAAYSLLQSTINMKNNTLLNSYQIGGNTSGLDVGVTWLYSLDRGRSFYVRLKHTNLKFEGSESGVSPALSTVGKSEVTAGQIYTTISLGMGF